MACACRVCLEHFRILGVAAPPTSKSALHKAYRAAAKRWHPDRFENNQRERHDAEERFKRINAAYVALCAHFENPAATPREPEFVTNFRRPPAPVISFGDAPDCFVAPHFPARVLEAIKLARLENSDPVVAFIDLSAGSALISEFILLTKHRMLVRDDAGILSVIWYADLGSIRLVDRNGQKQGAWQRIAEKIAGNTQRYSLQIDRLNLSRFRTLTDRPDDRVKKVIYNFLRQMKSNWQS
ncbi:J domain-containing protein [Telmatobacter sp. DSM 110680]|uniref:J domain-containing protein n=1 Tax=Telmatobacter sp. DSM 110680 TaxID=3036704 RepID=A0AAU7DKH8_9BACT